METEVIVSLGSLVIALLALNLESRIRDRAKLDVFFSEAPSAGFWRYLLQGVCP